MAIANETTHTLENGACRVDVNSATGAFSVVDKATGELWGADPWLGTAGILVVQRKEAGKQEIVLSKARDIDVKKVGDSAVEITFNGLPLVGSDGVLEAELKARVSLDYGHGDFGVEVLSLDLPTGWNFVELEYPCRFAALITDVDVGYTVVPYKQGSLIPSTMSAFQKIPHVEFWSWDDGPWTNRGADDFKVYGHNGLSMPFFGVVKGRSALAAVYETENDASVRVIMNNNYQHIFNARGEMSPYCRLSAVTALWNPEMGRFGYSRGISFKFVPDGNYVGIAKHYKKIAHEQGLAIKLRDKIQANPNIEKLFGAALINFNGGYPWYVDHPAFRYTWNDVKKYIDDLRNYVGLKRSLLTLWIGYQNYPPDSHPFHPAQGTVEELQDLMKYAYDREYQICFYHGYPALLDHAPNCDPYRATKSPTGSMGSRWGRHCSSFYLEYAKKNLPASVKDSHQTADYTDILTALGINECYENGHDHSRTQDRRMRTELLQFINSLGVFTGSEHPQGWAAPNTAYFKNGGYAAYQWIINQHLVPLFNLVYRDCNVMFREFYPEPDQRMMQDVAAGCHFQLHFDKDSYWRDGYWHTRESMKKAVEIVQDFNRHTGPEELLTHEWLEELNGPFRTRFSDGSEVLVNPLAESREVDGKMFGPETFLIKFSDGRRIEATQRRDWIVSKQP